MFRAQREQILANPDSGLDPGPPEASFSQDPTELRNEPVKEFHHLHQDEARQEGRPLQGPGSTNKGLLL